MDETKKMRCNSENLVLNMVEKGRERRNVNLYAMYPLPPNIEMEM